MATISKHYKKTHTDALVALAPALKCCLMKNTHTISASDQYYANISANECTGVGYTVGGLPLLNPASTNVGDNAKFTASNAIFSSVTITARYAVIYNPTSGLIVSQHDLGGDKVVTGGTLTLTWNVNGILTIS